MKLFVVALLAVVGYAFAACQVKLSTWSANEHCHGDPSEVRRIVASERCEYVNGGEYVKAKVEGDTLTATFFEDSLCSEDLVSAEASVYSRSECAPLGGGMSQRASWDSDCVSRIAEYEEAKIRALAEHDVISVLSRAQQFEYFIAKFNRTYSSPEERQHRYEVFNSTMDIADRLNKLGKSRHGVTKFSDLTPEEFRRDYLMSKNSSLPAPGAPGYQVVKHLKGAASSFDWRSKNAVTPVKDQGQCGSCWAFSATETIESAWILKGKPRQILAPQQIVDCDTAGSDQGCNGGLPDGAFTYVEQAGGLETESAYPYTAVQGTCRFAKAKAAATVSGYKSATPPGDEKTLQSTLTSVSPISIGVDATNWQTYTGGVMDEAVCAFTSIDHAVQLVGYNTAGTGYWIVRNSWNTNWGIAGYIELTMGQNTCGLTNIASYSTTDGTTGGGGSSSSTGENFDS